MKIKLLRNPGLQLKKQLEKEQDSKFEMQEGDTKEVDDSLAKALIERNIAAPASERKSEVKAVAKKPAVSGDSTNTTNKPGGSK